MNTQNNPLAEGIDKLEAQHDEAPMTNEEIYAMVRALAEEAGEDYEPIDMDEAQVQALAEALKADGEKLRALTGEDHGPFEAPEPSSPPLIAPEQVVLDLMRNLGLIKNLIAVVETDEEIHVLSNSMSNRDTVFLSAVLGANASGLISGRLQ